MENDGLVGFWFHSMREQDGPVDGQGKVIAKIRDDGIYLVQFYDWALGNPSACRLVDLGSMRFWLFYATDDDMRFSWKWGYARPGTSLHPAQEEQSQ